GHVLPRGRAVDSLRLSNLLRPIRHACRAALNRNFPSRHAGVMGTKALSRGPRSLVGAWIDRRLIKPPWHRNMQQRYSLPPLNVKRWRASWRSGCGNRWGRSTVERVVFRFQFFWNRPAQLEGGSNLRLSPTLVFLRSVAQRISATP